MRSHSALLLVLLGGALLTACALPYYMQAARGQMGLLRQREPLAEVIGDQTVDREIRERLELVTRLRRFAVETLELPDNKSYTSFVDLERDYVVYNVVAAGEFSLDPVTWCFPVAGCVAYRGYFDESRALKFADRLREKGFDVYTGGSPAYSTLGYFADPVLSTMLFRADADIAATLFHELAHQRVYVRDDTELSESFATAVEQYGVTAWLMSTGQQDQLEAWRQRLARQGEFAALVVRQRERLAAIYAEPLGDDAMRAAKRGAFAAMQVDYAALRAEWGGDRGYDQWFSGDINNAKLAAATSYQRWVPGLRARIGEIGPGAFFAEVEALAELDPEARSRALEALNDDSVAAAVSDLGERVGRSTEVGADDRPHALRSDSELGESVLAADARDRQ